MASRSMKPEDANELGSVGGRSRWAIFVSEITINGLTAIRSFQNQRHIYGFNYF